MAIVLNGSTGITTPSIDSSGGDIAATSLSVAGSNISAANSMGFRNRVINGAMVIDQRNAGASVTPTSDSYTLDRWQFPLSQASKLTVQRNAGSVTPPAGFSNYLGVTSSSAYSITSTDYFLLAQNFEGYNVADFSWGTANAKTVTLSFWVRSSLTGTFGGSVVNYGGATLSFPFSYSISSANTWTQVSVTVPGQTSGSWPTNNSGSITIFFSLGVGATYSGTAGSWASGAYYAPTGNTSVVGTNGATWYITGVQLEVGSVATEFERRPYGLELALCQRYYEIISFPSNVINLFVSSGVTSTSNSHHTWYLKQPKRTTPTFALMSGASWQNVTPNEIRTSVDCITFYSSSNYFFLSSSTASSPGASASAEL